MFFGFLVVCALYWLPTIIAVARKQPNVMAIAALNFFLGWTVIGWIISLVWSLAAVQPPAQVVVHVNNGAAEPK